LAHLIDGRGRWAGSESGGGVAFIPLHPHLVEAVGV